MCPSSKPPRLEGQNGFLNFPSRFSVQDVTRSDIPPCFDLPFPERMGNRPWVLVARTCTLLLGLQVLNPGLIGQDKMISGLFGHRGTLYPSRCLVGSVRASGTRGTYNVTVPACSATLDCRRGKLGFALWDHPGPLGYCASLKQGGSQLDPMSPHGGLR